MLSVASRRISVFGRSFASAADEVQDIVVIGGGPAGYVAAIKAGQMKQKVICVEERGTLGGTCLNVGCIPSKALLHSSHLFEETKKDLAAHGVMVDNPRVDLPKMMSQKSTAVSQLTSGIEMLFKKANVGYVKGHGRLSGDGQVTVDLSGGGTQVINTKNIIIATGSEVVPLKGITIDEKQIVSSTGALSLASIPKSMVVIGGGVIGLELGSVWQRLGAQVTVIEFMGALGSGMDLGTAKAFQQILERQGIKFLLEHKVSGAKATPAGVSLTVEPAKGGAAVEMQTDVLLCSVGRRPHTNNLGLAQNGIKMDDKGRIDIDAHWRTNKPNVYAVGDVVKGAMLAHKAEEEGIACVEYIVTKGGHVNYDAIPSVVYTTPEVAWVGKTEEQLKAASIQYNVGNFPFAANSRAKTIGQTTGFVKVLADAKTDKLLGVHIINQIAGDLIGEATLAVEYGASAEDIARTSHAHPGVGEALKEACMAACGMRAIHIP